MADRPHRGGGRGGHRIPPARAQPDRPALQMGDPRRLGATGGPRLDPVLSPDGRLLAYAAGINGAMRIQVRRVRRRRSVTSGGASAVTSAGPAGHPTERGSRFSRGLDLLGALARRIRGCDRGGSGHGAGQRLRLVARWIEDRVVLRRGAPGAGDERDRFAHRAAAGCPGPFGGVVARRRLARVRAGERRFRLQRDAARQRGAVAAHGGSRGGWHRRAADRWPRARRESDLARSPHPAVRPGAGIDSHVFRVAIRATDTPPAKSPA